MSLHRSGSQFLFRCACFAALALLCTSAVVFSQPAAPQDSSGDSPTHVPPLARDLSPALTRRAIAKAILKVGDWQLARAESLFNQDWTYAALYAGFMAVPEPVAGDRYREAMQRMGQRFQWQLGPRLGHADDEAIGQTYLDLYLRQRDPAMLAPTRDVIDRVMQLPDDKEKPLWWWCDALFMAPPVFVRLYQATGDKTYLDFMDRQWWITSGLLYSSKDHLYARDRSFLPAHEANGASLYWSRGNGWVMGGLVRVLIALPATYPSRPAYVRQFQQMAERIASIQGADGLWRPGLLDADAYKLPEVSGSAFYTYALAYGIRAQILDRKIYLPVVRKAWAGLLRHVYADGRLGSIQPIGAAPGVYSESSSYVFGTGAFLLAGSEVYRLAR